MRYIIRTTPDYLALVETPELGAPEEDVGKLVVINGQSVVALPEAAFWAVLKVPRPGHNPSIYADMVAENPERMARVEGAVGIGRLRQEKTVLTQSGLTRDTAHTTPPTPGTVIIDDGN